MTKIGKGPKGFGIGYTSYRPHTRSGTLYISDLKTPAERIDVGMVHVGTNVFVPGFRQDSYLGLGGQFAEVVRERGDELPVTSIHLKSVTLEALAQLAADCNLPFDRKHVKSAGD